MDGPTELVRPARHQLTCAFAPAATRETGGRPPTDRGDTMSRKQRSRVFAYSKIAAVLSLFAMTAGCGTSRSMPENAELLLNPQTGEYISPPCYDRDPQRFAAFTVHFRNNQRSDVRRQFSLQQLRGNARCRDMMFGAIRTPWSASGGFTETIQWFQKSSRWNADGSWNW
jgi:hypothetical protein